MNMINKVTNFVLNLHRKINSFYRTNEGGRTIRNSRQNKFRNRGKKLILAAKIVAIWYLLILTSSYLTSETGAAFNDLEVIKNSLHTDWDTQPETPDNNEWDKSSLSFDGSKAWEEGCKVYTTIENAGDKANTTSTWRFYLYKVTGNEKPTSGHVDTGVVPTIDSGDTGQITATVEENGKYRFSVRRPLGHKGNNQPDKDGYSYIWSDNIVTVTNCNSPQEPDSSNPPSSEGDAEVPNNTEVPTENEVPTETNQPINEVTDLEWENSEKGDSGKFIISWSNPPDSNFKTVNVYEDGEVEPKYKNISDGKIEINGGDKDVIYTIKTMYKEEKESTGIKITVSKTEVKINK
ncbi:MAG: amyloid fiber anchoring/assembly protein TapA [Neobacillus sp.]|nr:amyloid fiber anchoring/assembly protein TapA [Neobacillus sp.]